MLLNRLRGNPKATASTPHAPRSILPDNIPLEFRILLSACRVFLGTEEPARLEATLAQGPDWDKLLRLANRHGVMPLLYRSISKNCPQAVTQDRLAGLRMRYLQNAARNLKMTTELLRILDLFESHGIPAIPFKGPALAQQIYGDITLRTFSDLDIIVKREDVLRAKDVLISDGYRTEYKLTSTQEKAVLDYDCEYHFNQEERNFRIDLHWRFNQSCHFIEVDFPGFWSRMGTIALEKRDVFAPSPEDLLLALCIHNARHHCNDLKLVGDIAGLINLHKDLDWNSVLQQAKKMGIERIICLNVGLAEDLFKSDVPEAVSGNARNVIGPSFLNSHVRDELLLISPDSSRIVREMMFWFLARERFRDGLNCILNLAFEPNAADWQKFPLPSYAYSLYYLIHPIRLIYLHGI